MGVGLVCVWGARGELGSWMNGFFFGLCGSLFFFEVLGKGFKRGGFGGGV